MEILGLVEKIFNWLYRRFGRWRELKGFYEKAVREAEGSEAIKRAALEIVRSDFFTEFIQSPAVSPEQEFSEFLRRLKGMCPEADESAIVGFLEKVYTRLATEMEAHETWDKRGDEIKEFLRQRRQPIEETAFERVPEQRTYLSHFSDIPRTPNFLDREEELKRLKEWLKDEEQTVGALVGVGGQGKTYLAAKFAEECLQNGWQVRWADFPFTVEHFLLSIASEMQNCGDQYASIVGDPQQKFEVRIDNAIRFLESQQQPWLIVLDDFHKATEDKWQEVIALFDQHCRKTKILLTARREPEAFEELKLPTGAHEILDVPKLPREVAKDYLQALELPVDDDRAERIWEKCSGNPVAMKLFAQAARRRSAEKLLQMPLPEWSENAQKWMDELLSDLSELAKEAAKRLSIFDEPVEHDLLLAIGATEKGLFELQDYRLAEKTIDERWQEHDLLRQYWKAKLSEEEKVNWHRLAGEWLKGQAERIKVEKGERKFEEWSLELQQTWANYLHRAFWQFASAEAVKEALKAASPITELLDRWGEWDENLRLCQKALELARKSKDEKAIAIWAHKLAIRHHDRGNYEEAEKLYRESLEIKERLGDLQGKAAMMHRLGILAYDRGNYEEAERLYRESFEINERFDNLQGKAEILHGLGILAYDRGNYEEAEKLYYESLEIKERLGDLRGKAATLYRLGRLAHNRGNYEEAERLYRESLEINERLGYLRGKAATLHRLGRLAHDRGNYEEAERLYCESLEIKERIGYLRGKAATLHHLGRLAHDRGNYEEAERLYLESLEIRKRLGNLQGKAKTLHGLGVLAHARGNYEEAERLYRESLEISERLGNLSGKAETLHELGRLAYDRGNYEEAERLYRESLGIFERLGFLAGKAAALRQLGLLRKEQGRKDEAKWLLKQALEIFEGMGHRYAEDVRKDLEALRKEEQGSTESS